jgi:hypothetical protein
MVEAATVSGLRYRRRGMEGEEFFFFFGTGA